MSLIPDFELGIWNAWILVLSFNLIVNGLGKAFERKFDNKGTRPDRPLLSILLGETGMVYKMRYDGEADVLTFFVSEEGGLSYAEEVGDMVIHLDRKGRPLFVEILNASKIVPLMVQVLAKGEVSVH
jgi:uncharacterized protein YuzE